MTQVGANLNQARKKSTKINFLGPETAGRVGWVSSAQRGGGRKVRSDVPSLESLCSLGFRRREPGMPQECTPGGIHKACAKAKLVPSAIVLAHISIRRRSY